MPAFKAVTLHARSLASLVKTRGFGMTPQKYSGFIEISMYSAQLLDHFEHPRNAGELDSADAIAEVANPVCGDVMRLSLKVRGGRIEEVRFKAKGCVPSMACGSALTELVRGRMVSDAGGLQREQLVDAVGGLPQASTHAAQLALDVLAAALRQVGQENK